MKLNKIICIPATLLLLLSMAIAPALAWTANCYGASYSDGLNTQSDVQYAQSQFYAVGYSVNSQNYMNQQPSTIVNNMPNSQIFYYAGHGNAGNIWCYPTDNNPNPNTNYLYAQWPSNPNAYTISSISSLSNTLLAFFSSCYSANTDSLFGNLLSKCNEKGVTCSVGFTDAIAWNQAQTFDNNFCRALYWGYPVWQAIGYAQSQTYQQYNGDYGGVQSCSYQGDYSITIYPAGDIALSMNALNNTNTVDDPGLKKAKENIRQAIGTPNVNFTSIHKANISSGKMFWSIVANNTLFIVDSDTGKIVNIIAMANAENSTVKLSLDEAMNRAKGIMEKYNKNSLQSKDMKLVSGKLVDLGNDVGKQYWFTWREDINGIYTLNSTGISINPNTGELIAYASTEGPLLVNLNQSTIPKEIAITKAAHQFIGINMSDLKTCIAQLEVDYTPNRSQALVWAVELQEVKPNGIVYGGEVQVNAVTGEVIYVNPYR
ncbi:hypothetical protein [Methanocella conradii]|uniref:hypothetical protein n=1 Tax=Methanocella conradii TaxID=1175444 RepID=UPI00157D3938|nr:hypothetical protein [Methanocella conradii]